MDCVYIKIDYNGCFWISDASLDFEIVSILKL